MAFECYHKWLQLQWARKEHFGDTCGEARPRQKKAAMPTPQSAEVSTSDPLWVTRARAAQVAPRHCAGDAVRDCRAMEAEGVARARAA